MADVRINQLSKTFRGGIEALRECDLALADGECLAVLGPSGCGKTTLLRLIAGLEQPTSGMITIGNHNVTGLPPRERDVSMVFQDFALYPHMRVRRNLSFAPALNGMPQQQLSDRVERVAVQLGLCDLLDRKPSTLSGGERQRVALGRVLVRQPGCALFDEPLSHLDTQLRHSLRRELRAVLDTFRPTAIYVTHDQDEAMTIGDRVAIMRAGKIHQVGTPEEIAHAPADRFVAGFLGNPPMNLIEGQLAQHDDQIVFRAGKSFIVPLSSEVVDELPPGHPIVLGLRPEAVTVVNSQQPHSITMPASVLHTESFPARSIVHIRAADGVELAASLNQALTCDLESSITVSFDPNAVFLFEKGEAGRLLYAPGITLKHASA